MKQVNIGTAPALNRPVLASESARQLEQMRDRFFADLKPADFIEEMLANDFLSLVLEMDRYRRAKAALLDSVRAVALANVLALGKADPFGAGKEERELAVAWFDNPEGRARVRDMLASRDLDDTAIDGEAMRIRLGEIDTLDRLIASAQTRRDRALQHIADYRSFFAQILYAKATRLIEAERPLDQAVC